MTDLLKYLAEWDRPGRDGDAKNASGADPEGDGNNDSGNPYRWNMPPSPEWGIGDKGSMTSYGHSDDVVEKKDYAAWGLEKSDVERGYSSPKSDGEGAWNETRQPGGSFPQSIPQNYTGPGADRGAGSDVRSREFSAEGKGFEGEGNDKPSPGREAMGSSKLPS